MDDMDVFVTEGESIAEILASAGDFLLPSCMACRDAIATEFVTFTGERISGDGAYCATCAAPLIEAGIAVPTV